MSTNALIRAYLENIHSALVNREEAQAKALLQHALELFPEEASSNALELASSPLQLVLEVGLHSGLKRHNNEDYTFAYNGMLETGEQFGLLIVADGMGGHAKGQDASRLAVHQIADDILDGLYCKQSRGSDRSEDMLCQAVRRANAGIYARNKTATSTRDRDKMGTTLTAALIVDTHSVVVNVGDSRVYLYRPGIGLRKVTRDHSVVQRKVELGIIGPDDIYTDPERNIITRSLGMHETVEVDVFHEDIGDGDILLLCSDGLWEMTRDPKIEEVVRDSQISPKLMVERLIHLALEGGGRDNIACVLAQASAVVDIATLETQIFPSLISLPV